MKKTYIIATVILIILIIGQSIYYLLNKQNNDIPNSSYENVTETINTTVKINNIDVNLLYIENMNDLYIMREPGMSKKELQEEIYKFMYINLPNTYNAILGKSNNEIEEYYEENKDTINQMNIYSKDAFVMLMNQAKNIYTEKQMIITNKIIPSESIKDNNDGYIEFDIEYTFDNNTNIYINVKMGKNENKKIIFDSNSPLDKMLRDYKGDVTKKDILEKINTITSSVNDIRLRTSLTTKNSRYQYFDNNGAEMEKLGLTTADDYYNLSIQINLLNWNDENIRYINYSVKEETYKKEQYYDSFEVLLNYSTGDSIKLKMWIRNSSNATPSIRISNYEEV